MGSLTSIYASNRFLASWTLTKWCGLVFRQFFSHVGIALFDRADYGDDIFVAQLLGFVVSRGIEFAIDHNLRNSGAVAQVNKNDAAEVAAAVDPSHEHGFFAGIG